MHVCVVCVCVYLYICFNHCIYQFFFCRAICRPKKYEGKTALQLPEDEDAEGEFMVTIMMLRSHDTACVYEHVHASTGNVSLVIHCRELVF